MVLFYHLNFNSRASKDLLAYISDTTPNWSLSPNYLNNLVKRFVNSIFSYVYFLVVVILQT